LLHLTFDAAQESHEALSFSFLSLPDEGVLGDEVGDDMMEVDVGLLIMTGERQQYGCDVGVIIVVAIEGLWKSRCRVESKLSVVLPRRLES
jgi:hypothetical protein